MIRASESFRTKRRRVSPILSAVDEVSVCADRRKLRIRLLRSARAEKYFHKWGIGPVVSLCVKPLFKSLLALLWGKVSDDTNSTRSETKKVRILRPFVPKNPTHSHNSH